MAVQSGAAQEEQRENKRFPREGYESRGLCMDSTGTGECFRQRVQSGQGLKLSSRGQTEEQEGMSSRNPASQEVCCGGI